MNIRKVLARFKRKLTKKAFIKNKIYPAFWFNKLLGGQSAMIVQIGSNDGKTGDPLYELLHKNKEWKALFVEPIPHYFEKLKQNYPDNNRFTFENVAVNNGEELEFHWVDPTAKNTFPDLPFWFEQLGSFDRQHILNQLNEKIAPFIISKKLKGSTLPEIFDRNEIKKLDLIHIDAEGYDWKILSQLDIEKYQPKFILFEYHHLTKAELAEAYQFLIKDYEIFKVGIDVFCIHQTLGASIIREINLNKYMSQFSIDTKS